MTTNPSGFEALGVSAPLVGALRAEGFTSPFPIQELGIPAGLSGVDVCGRARTGTGKTLAFGPVLLERCSPAKPGAPTGLVIAPTRELAKQIADVLEPLAAAVGRRVAAIYGGRSRRDQESALEEGVDIVVATPLRLVDLVTDRSCRLDAVEVVVVDEADRMADDGFLPQLEWLLRRVTAPHQTLLYSATLDGAVKVVVDRWMRDPITVAVDEATSTVDTMRHVFVEAHPMDRDRVVAAIGAHAERVVTFTQTKRAADKLVRALKDLGCAAAAMHGDLPQAVREKTLRAWAAGKVRVLVATDVAARGLDVAGVDVVVHYDLPTDAKAYLHRSGRTARAGEAGVSIVLAQWNQHLHVRMLQRALGLPISDELELVLSNDPRWADLDAFDAATTAVA